MHKQTVVLPPLVGNLPNRFEKRLTFYVSCGTAYFRENDVGVAFLPHLVYKAFYFVCDMGNNLHGFSEIFPLALLVEHVPIHLSRREIAVLVEIFVDKPLVVPQIEVGFRAVLRHINLSVLIRTHCARVHVDVRVHFLSRHFQPARFEQPPDRSHGDAFPQA